MYVLQHTCINCVCYACVCAYSLPSDTIIRTAGTPNARAKHSPVPKQSISSASGQYPSVYMFMYAHVFVQVHVYTHVLITHMHKVYVHL